MLLIHIRLPLQEVSPTYTFNCTLSNAAILLFKRLAPVVMQQWLCTIKLTLFLDTCYRSGNGPAGLYTQQYQVVTGDVTSYYWIVNGQQILMHCPPGTYFDCAQCQCVLCVPGIPCGTSDPITVLFLRTNSLARISIRSD